METTTTETIITPTTDEKFDTALTETVERQAKATGKPPKGPKPPKAAKTAKVTPQVEAPAKVGVIASLVALLSDGTKRTRGELYDALVKQFPERASETGGVRVTISVQCGSGLAKKGHKVQHEDSDRGKLYYIAAK